MNVTFTFRLPRWGHCGYHIKGHQRCVDSAVVSMTDLLFCMRSFLFTVVD